MSPLANEAGGACQETEMLEEASFVQLTEDGGAAGSDEGEKAKN